MLEEEHNLYMTHIAHCCLQHGCKYGDNNCPVFTKKAIQSHPCRDCGLAQSSELYGEANEIGFYDSDMVWHEPTTNELQVDPEVEKLVEDKIINQICSFLREPLDKRIQNTPEHKNMYRIACCVAELIETKKWKNDR